MVVKKGSWVGKKDKKIFSINQSIKLISALKVPREYLIIHLK